MIKVSMAAAAVALVACSNPQEMGEAVGVDAENPTYIADPQAHEVLVENEQMRFSFSWPAEAVGIPALNAVFEARAKAKQDDFAATTAEAQADAEKYGYPYRTFDFARNWEVAADTPRFLSLAAATYAYTGGAHGNTWFDSMIWDREAETEMAQTDLFTSAEAFEGAVRETYCAGLRDERTERIGPSITDGTDIFDSCPALDELVMVFEASDGKTFDRINLIAAPYVAGSYAEGPYEVRVPVTQAVIDAAKPEYRAALTVGT